MKYPIKNPWAAAHDAIAMLGVSRIIIHWMWPFSKMNESGKRVKAMAKPRFQLRCAIVLRVRARVCVS